MKTKNSIFFMCAVVMFIISISISMGMYISIMSLIVFYSAIFTFSNTFVNLFLSLIFSKKLNDYQIFKISNFSGALILILLIISKKIFKNQIYNELWLFSHNGGFVALSIMILFLSFIKVELIEMKNREIKNQKEKMHYLDLAKKYKKSNNNLKVKLYKDKIDDLENEKYQLKMSIERLKNKE